jgi:hypothetical protein
LTLRPWIPSPPWSFGWQPHSTWPVYTFSFLYHLAKRILIGRNPIYLRLLLVEGRRITYTVPCLTWLNLWEPVFLLWTTVYLSNYLNATQSFLNDFPFSIC